MTESLNYRFVGHWDETRNTETGKHPNGSYPDRKARRGKVYSKIRNIPGTGGTESRIFPTRSVCSRISLGAKKGTCLTRPERRDIIWAEIEKKLILQELNKEKVEKLIL